MAVQWHVGQRVGDRHSDRTWLIGFLIPNSLTGFVYVKTFLCRSLQADNHLRQTAVERRCGVILPGNDHLAGFIYVANFVVEFLDGQPLFEASIARVVACSRVIKLRADNHFASGVNESGFSPDGNFCQASTDRNTTSHSEIR